LDPEKILVKDVLAEPHRIIAGPQDEGIAQFEALGQAFKVVAVFVEMKGDL